MTAQREAWQQELINLVTDPQMLLNRLSLDQSLLPAAQAAVRLFPLKVTESYLSRIKPGDVNDPLLRQVLPLHNELDDLPDYIADPLLELEAKPLKGLLHKYRSRVLVSLTANCAIHCRYCFRRHFPVDEKNPGRVGWQAIFDYIAEKPEINEVILSGADPLSVNDKMLLQFTEQLNHLTQIKRLRLHTRIPVVLPNRITREFVNWAKNLKQQCVMVLHVNHANEIDSNVSTKLKLLHDAGIALLNQSVLLKGVNDKAADLAALSEKLFENNVLPYYLHVLDKVKGAHHFDLPLFQAKALYKEIQALLPGYLVPRLVCEQGGEPAKTLIL